MIRAEARPKPTSTAQRNWRRTCIEAIADERWKDRIERAWREKAPGALLGHRQSEP